MRSLATLRLSEIILHEVPAAARHDDDAAPVKLSNAPIEVSTPQRHYFQERLRRSLGNGDAREVVEADIDPPAEVPRWLAAFLDESDDDFIDLSRRLAIRLREVQTGSSNPGLLLVAACTWGGSRALLLAKVELERAVRARPSDVDGVVTYSVSLLTDLVFGETSRIFKVGLFSRADLDDARLAGWAIDRQRSGPEIAGFFLNEYLGCDYARQPALVTKEFFDTSQAWINSLHDAEAKARYEVALVAEMQRAQAEVRPADFARDHLSEDDRDAFMASLPPGTAGGFAKNVELIPLKLVKVETLQGVTVLAQHELVGDTQGDVVQVQQNEITIRDRVIGFGGSGRQRRPRPPRNDETGTDEEDTAE